MTLRLLAGNSKGRDCGKGLGAPAGHQTTMRHQMVMSMAPGFVGGY